MSIDDQPSANDVAIRAATTINSLASELSSAYADLINEVDRDIKLMSGIKKRDKEIARLKEHIGKLEATKAVKLQKRYWRIRNSFGKK